MLRLEVIDFLDQTGQAIVQRIPAHGTAAIQYGAQLIVQQNQEAIFFRDGRAMDSFGPGRHTLTTANVPILTRLLTMPWERSPFQASVIFVAKHRFIDQRWGTRAPITMRDPDFGIVRLRGFGKYSFRVVDAPLLVNELVGTRGRMTTEDVNEFLRDTIVAGLTDLLATSNIGLLQMAARFDEIAAAARVKLADGFSRFGLELLDLVLNNISPPEEVQKAIDARSSMAALGDLRAYTLYQAANGLGGIANSGTAGAGAGLGVGAGLGMLLPPLLQQSLQGAPQVQPGIAATGGVMGTATGTATGVGAAAGNSAAGTAGVSGRSLDFSELKAAGQAQSDVRGMVRTLAARSGWEVSGEAGDSWTLTVPLGNLRKQQVHIDFGARDDEGDELLSVWSVCGDATAANAKSLLRHNARLVHGAFAYQMLDEQEHLTLRANLLADTADALELTRVITAIAWQADGVEQQLFGGDER
jgi:membrane protease subunit (stomatin/prohibitin family)